MDLGPDALAERLAPVLRRYPEVTYVMLFGSTARGTAHARSDVDLAVGGTLDMEQRRALERDLEEAVGRATQVVPVAHASPAVRARIFREGIPLHEFDHEARVRDHTRAFIEYVDYQPVEALFLERSRRRLMGTDPNGG